MNDKITTLERCTHAHCRGRYKAVSALALELILAGEPDVQFRRRNGRECVIVFHSDAPERVGWRLATWWTRGGGRACSLMQVNK